LKRGQGSKKNKTTSSLARDSLGDPKKPNGGTTRKKIACGNSILQENRKGTWPKPPCRERLGKIMGAIEEVLGGGRESITFRASEEYVWLQ